MRGTGNPLCALARLASLIVVAIAVLLPFSLIGTYFGFVPPPVRFYFIHGGMVLVYLVVVELAKQGFYRWAVTKSPPSTSRLNPR